MKTVVAFLAAIAQVAILGATDQAAKSAFVRNSEIYVTIAGSNEVRQITADGVRKGSVVLSQDGARIAFTRDAEIKELANIIIMQPDGAVLREIHFRPAAANIIGMRFVEGLLWITNNRLIVSGSVNPSIGEHAIVDADTGKEVGGYVVDGSSFAPSPDGSHVAYERSIPHFTWQEHRRPQLCLDDECGPTPAARGGYPRPNRHVEFTSNPIWSPDGTQVAITAQDDTTKAESVIVRTVGHKTAEFTPPPEAAGGLRFSWVDNTVDIKTANGEWKLQAGTTTWSRMK